MTCRRPSTTGRAFRSLPAPRTRSCWSRSPTRCAASARTPWSPTSAPGSPAWTPTSSSTTTCATRTSTRRPCGAWVFGSCGSPPTRKPGPPPAPTSPGPTARPPASTASNPTRSSTTAARLPLWLTPSTDYSGAGCDPHRTRHRPRGQRRPHSHRRLRPGTPGTQQLRVPALPRARLVRAGRTRHPGALRADHRRHAGRGLRVRTRPFLPRQHHGGHGQPALCGDPLRSPVGVDPGRLDPVLRAVGPQRGRLPLDAGDRCDPPGPVLPRTDHRQARVLDHAGRAGRLRGPLPRLDVGGRVPAQPRRCAGPDLCCRLRTTVLRRHVQMGRTVMSTIAIVDAYSTARYFAPLFQARGLRCVHVQSARTVPAVYARTFRPDDFAAHVVHRGDDAETATAVAGYRPVALIAGIESGVELADRLSERLGLRTNGTALSTPRRHKFAMVERVKQCGLPGAAQVLAADRDTLVSWYAGSGAGRVVVKPVRSAGN